MKPWYTSTILQAQIAQLIIAALTMLGITTDIDWNATTGAIFAGIAALMAVWTVVSRLFKANTPITNTAAVKRPDE